MKTIKTRTKGRPAVIPTHCGFKEDTDYFTDVRKAVDEWCRKNGKIKSLKERLRERKVWRCDG